jgi:hypothetical protein
MAISSCAPGGYRRCGLVGVRVGCGDQVSFAQHASIESRPQAGSRTFWIVALTGSSSPILRAFFLPQSAMFLSTRNHRNDSELIFPATLLKDWPQCQCRVYSASRFGLNLNDYQPSHAWESGGSLSSLIAPPTLALQCGLLSGGHDAPCHHHGGQCQVGQGDIHLRGH